MSASTALPKDHPMMIAWEMYKQTQEFANTLNWAAYSDHRTGSLWAAFSKGWQASIESQAAEIARLTAERDSLRVENERLRAALTDVLSSNIMRPSCQNGLVSKCQCQGCVTVRARAALNPAAQREPT